MSKQILEDMLQDKKNLFIPYIMAGDGEGGLANLEERIAFLAENGVSAVELGIPFSDPVADGPVIQDAGQRALEKGVTLGGVFAALKVFSAKPAVPIVFMTYFNPIYSYGFENFARDCVDSGVSGVIVPDLPMEEDADLVKVLKENNIAFIRLATLTSPKERLEEIAKQAEGFLYAVAVTGITGARNKHGENVKDYLKTLSDLSQVPVLAGFGVSNLEQAKDLGSACNGVIVGSKIVRSFHEGKTEEIAHLIKQSVAQDERTNV